MKRSNPPSLLLLSLVCLSVPTYLYINNRADTPFLTFLRVVLVSLAAYWLLFLLSRLFFKDALKRGLFTAVVFLLLSLYGAVYSLLESDGSIFGHHKVLAVLLAGLVLLWGLAVGKIKSPETFANAGAVTVVVFLLIQLIDLGSGLVSAKEPSAAETSDDGFNRQVEVFQSESSGRPDVYYIILDMYTREDVLQIEFGFDNSAFIDALEEIGFYVGDCSRSNYMFTEASLASSLNMMYLQDASSTFTPGNTDKSLLDEMIKDSTVFEEFEALGYRTIAFETGYNFTQIETADEYLAPDHNNYLLASIQPFDILVLEDGIFKLLFDTHIPVVDELFDRAVFPYNDHVERQHFILDSLQEIAEQEEATFTFAHITVPHQPFVFMPDGGVNKDRRFYSGESREPVSEELYNEGYVNQVLFINDQILAAVKQILDNSSEPPIIILQGDHGAKIENRLPILNAYYFPGASDQLYADISPVNSFRVLFDAYFDAGLPLLDDSSYISSYDYPYDWTMTTESADQCQLTEER